ncbi:hypothetical protein HN51_042267 [Arachis hypogaea]|nr:Fasciclin-like arabinogalactan protein [Arachis hypogaea]
MFQATGTAAGTASYVNITNLKGDKIGFASKDNDRLHSFYVKSIQEIPYIFILEISSASSFPKAKAPTAAPNQINIVNILSKKSCKSFADLLKSLKALPTF